MKRIIPIIFSSLIFLFFFAFIKNEKSRKLPSPTDINENKEMKQKRKEWWEKKHGAAEGVDWKAIDQQTRRQRAEKRNQYRKELFKKGELKRGEKILETLGNGSLTGEWRERGSTNIAGRMHTCDIDFATNTVYAGSSGGVLWKGPLDGDNWEPLNDFMSNEIIFVRYLNLQNANRLYMAGGKYFYYSDNDGLTWETAAGLENIVSWGNIVRVVVTASEPKIFYALVLEWDYGPAWQAVAGLYRSDNMGENFVQITTFPGWANNIDLWTARYGTTGDVYMVKDSEFFKLDNSGQPQFVANIGGSAGDAVLTGLEENNGMAKLAVFLNGKIYRSDDSGANWTYKGDEPDWLWGRNSFTCSLNNPDRLYFGSVNCHISNNGGANWFARNEWYDYYGQEYWMLHADIDGIDIFHTPEGDELIMVSTDGGLYKSYNQLNVVNNISMRTLRTGQFYSTYTNRNNTNYIYMGSQDQGFQKCRVDSGGVLGFKQSISGDYGSIVSGDEGHSIWTVYPGFAMYYPDAAHLLDNAYFWDFSGDNWQWMAPMMSDPYDYNYAFTGGGAEGMGGQYLWHLQYISGNILADRQPFNFAGGMGLFENEITAIAYSPVNWDYRYVLTNKGRFFYSSDEGLTWNLTTFNQPNFRGNVIIPSQTQLGKVIIGGSGYSNPGVYISDNHGQNFSPLNTNIPQTSFNDLKLSATELLLFAATDAGPYFYNFNTQEWYDMAGQTAPDQVYMSVDYIPSTNIVRFGTYGRGTWDFAIQDEPLVTVAENEMKNQFQIFPNPFSAQSTITFTMKESARVLIEVYDAKGQKVFSENKGKLPAGEQTIIFNREQLRSGIYFVALTTGSKRTTGKIVVR